MMRFMRFRSRGAIALQPAGRAAAVLLAALAGGCSASVSGFDFPSFSLNDDPPRQTAAASSRSNPSYLGNDGYGSGGYSAPRTYRESSVTTQNLPDASPSSGAYSGGRYGDNYAAATPRSDTNNYGRSASNSDRGGSTNSYGHSPGHNSYTDSGRYGTVAPASTASTNRYDPQPTPSLASPGDTIEVQSGDTLYGLSRRYNVSVAELMQINNLTSTNLALGQRLYLPQGVASNRYGAQPPTQTASIQPPPAPPSADYGNRSSGTYTVQPGDSLYGISRNFGVPVAELQRANGITDARGVKAGTVLRVPNGSGGSSHGAMQQVVVTPPAQQPQQYSTPSYSSPQQPAPQQAVAQSNGVSSQPTIINGNGNGGGTQYTQVATRNTNSVAVGAPQSPRQSSGSDKLRWPVSGRIITGFGQRADGTHNDGINLSVPLGTSVHAAESGTVAYAGAELKGYGNLVLLRHDNGWVTAYAHNDQLMVKRGDKVQRGQVIATAGRTGSVDQPQVHFELRQGSKPVDPVPFLERL